MDLRKLKTLVDLVSESNISELEITEADGKVRIVKSERSFAAQRTGSAAAVAMRRRSPPAPGRARQPAAAEPLRRRSPVETGHVVTLADGRHLLPRVQPGRQAVRRGRHARQGRRPVCIIEAMKMHERDRRRRRRHDHQDPGRERPGRSNSASRCS